MWKVGDILSLLRHGGALSVGCGAAACVLSGAMDVFVYATGMCTRTRYAISPTFHIYIYNYMCSRYKAVHVLEYGIRIDAIVVSVGYCSLSAYSYCMRTTSSILQYMYL